MKRNGRFNKHQKNGCSKAAAAMTMKRTASRKFFVLLCVLLLILIDFLHVSANHQLRRFPYIQNPTASSITIVWETDTATQSGIEYGLTPSLGQSEQASKLTTRHEVVLSGLDANATYYYRVVSPSGPLMDVATFRTNKVGPHPDFSFVVFGDCGTGGQSQHEVAEQMRRTNPDFGIITGDIVYPRGSATDYDRKYFLPYKDIISSVCLYPSLGNHDCRTHEGKPYFDAFVLPANNSENSEKYYSFDYANAHFICLDSTLRIGNEEEEKQFQWLKSDLSSTNKLWKFVFFHHPPYSSSHHGSEMRIRKRYCPLFEEYSVDIAFCGHDHDYERTVRIHEFFPEKSGVIYVVTGGGGGALYNSGKSEWTAFSKKTHHFVQVNIKGETLLMRAIDATGKEFDRLLFDKSLP